MGMDTEHQLTNTREENSRQEDVRSVWKERPVGGQHVHVRIEVRQVPEGLHEQDQAGRA